MDRIKAFAALIISVFTYLFGGFDGLMTALAAAIAADYITGVIAAAVKKQLSSEIGAKGIAKKILMLIVAAVAHIIDVSVIGSGDMLRTMTVLFYIANESISILENAGNIGVPLPSKLMEFLEQLKSENGGNNNESN